MARLPWIADLIETGHRAWQASGIQAMLKWPIN